MTDIDPTSREQADDKSTRRPFWRLPVIIGVAVVGMVLWIVVRLIW